MNKILLIHELHIFCLQSTGPFSVAVKFSSFTPLGSFRSNVKHVVPQTP